MRSYRYLLFDADNTLFDFDRAEKEAFSEACGATGVPFSKELYERYTLINDGLWKEVERGTLTRDVLKYKRFADLLGDGETARQTADAYAKALAHQSFPIEGADGVLAALSARYGIYVVTNGIAAIQHSRFDASPLMRHIAGLFISEEIGYSKPDARFFEAALDKIGDHDRSHYLVIGDSLSSDIAGAANAGLDACWYNPKKKPCGDDRPAYTVSSLTELIPLLTEATC